jgi:hypothetical protein
LSSGSPASPPGLHRRRKRPTPDSGNSDTFALRRASQHASIREEHKSNTIGFGFYFSAAAVVGCVSRVYLSRFFGGDCESHDIVDFLTPLSSQICVTAGGTTLQTGGALFRDLPSNLLGCFVLGLISPPIAQEEEETTRSRIPWFHKDHPLQKDDVFHTSLGVGLCGCLTTFASWNTQMIVMMVRYAAS